MLLRCGAWEAFSLNVAFLNSSTLDSLNQIQMILWRTSTIVLCLFSGFDFWQLSAYACTAVGLLTLIFGMFTEQLTFFFPPIIFPLCQIVTVCLCALWSLSLLVVSVRLINAVRFVLWTAGLFVCSMVVSSRCSSRISARLPWQLESGWVGVGWQTLISKVTHWQHSLRSDSNVLPIQNL